VNVTVPVGDGVPGGTFEPDSVAVSVTDPPEDGTLAGLASNVVVVVIPVDPSETTMLAESIIGGAIIRVLAPGFVPTTICAGTLGSTMYMSVPTFTPALPSAVTAAAYVSPATSGTITVMKSPGSLLLTTRFTAVPLATLVP
jgi:hypothetical protein